MSMLNWEPHFEVNDKAQMMVTSDGCKDYKHFTIRACQRTDAGLWQYQLNEKDTGDPYKGNSWFAESQLRDL
ncbi:hypothetical protein IQ07DRAFT_109985 [Pyrenochaeta sp. DS3sAY3a]|nr:hypothetical protein IQ07DRAFT_109985 [Pyrenochaeta sp. DS3sAY3a]